MTANLFIVGGYGRVLKKNLKLLVQWFLEMKGRRRQHNRMLFL